MAKGRRTESLAERLNRVVREAHGRSDVLAVGALIHRDVKPANMTLPARAAHFPLTGGSRQVGDAERAPKPLPLVRLSIARRDVDRIVPAIAGPVGDGAVADRNVPGPPAADHSTQTTEIATVADIGAVVRRARRSRGLSQAELASRAGTGRRFVSELESGKPTIEIGRLLAVCRALGFAIMAGPVQP